jgi:SAM-dependent methyltransferase
MCAYQGNLCARDDENPSAFTGPEFHDFDIAAVGLGFHHFDDPDLAARRLVARLKPGGVLVIIDFLPHHAMDGLHPATATVTHHGFSEERIREVFANGGAIHDFRIEDIGNVVFHRDGKEPMRRRLFIARGTKA